MSFEESIAAGKVTVFKATWCGPCKAYAPVVEQATPEIEAKGYSVRTLDADSHRDIAAEYGIRGVPSTVIEKADGSRTVLVGLQSKEKLLESL